MTRENIIAAFDARRPLYGAFAQKVAQIVEELAEAASINVHSITCRSKSKESLERKLLKPEASYAALEDITDLAGVRIITYFEDEVDLIATILQREFTVDHRASIDKRSILDPDRFGYLSLHHVVELNDERARLFEYRRYQGLKAEVQTRSILQHAWAEIEHDLGYKAASEVPRQVRRRFSRLAGVLELADKEFSAVRDELLSYQQVLEERIIRQPESVLIDRASLTAFVTNAPVSLEADRMIGEGPAEPDDTTDHLVGYTLPRLAALNIDTVADLQTAMTQYTPQIVRFAREWYPDPEDEPAEVPRGMAVFYLSYIIVVERGHTALLNFINQIFPELDERDRAQFVARIEATYNEIRKE